MGGSRVFLILAAVLAGWPAQSQDWPAKPVKIVVPFAPGGSSDQLARLLAPQLSARLGQQFFIENRAGSSGALGSAQVARAEPDGYTFVNAGSGPHLTGPAINPNIGYDPLRDFTHVAMEAADTFVVAVNPSLGIRSIADLVTAAGRMRLTSASPGWGSLGHLLLERFKRSARIDIAHVPAPNSGMNEVLGNHISMTFTTLITAGAQIKAGNLVPVAVSSVGRHPVYPDIASFSEQGFPEVRGDTWFWIAGPKNLPSPIVRALNSEMRRIMASPAMRRNLDGMGLSTVDLDPDGVAKFIGEEYAYWAPLAKEAGLSVQ